MKTLLKSNHTVSTPTSSSDEEYNPIISSNSVLQQNNSINFLERYLLIKNYLSEFTTEEEKRRARENLGVLSDIIVLEMIDNAISDLKGDVSVDYDTLEKIEAQLKEQIRLALYYNSLLPDDLTTPNKIGGLNKGTSVSTLKTKTLSQIFDDILFEELLPNILNPSCSISLKDNWRNNGIYEVGYSAPTTDNFNVSFNRGTCTVVGYPNKYRAGEEVSRSITMNPSGELVSNIILGAITYKLTIQHAEGELLVTSKGNPASISPNPLTAGSVSSTCTIYGTYPYFCNGLSASTSSLDTNLPSLITSDTKLPLLKWTDTLVGAKFASEADTGTRLEFHFPNYKNIIKVEFFNTVSSKWELFGNNNYTISSIEDKQIQGLSVEYKKLTTQGALNGALQLRFTLGNARLLSEPILLNTGNRAEGIAGFAVNFEPGGQAPLDARLLVPTKADLINPNTYSKKNYYKGMAVTVEEDGSEYILMDISKILNGDYSGWKLRDSMDISQSLPESIITDLVRVDLSENNVSIITDKVSKSERIYGNTKEASISIPAVSITTAGVMTATDKINIDTTLPLKILDETTRATAKENLLEQTINNNKSIVDNHITNKENPHSVTKAQIGLGNVDNTADLNKPVSIAQQAAIDKVKSEILPEVDKVNSSLTAHVSSENNPHKVTKAQIGLGDVDNTRDINKPISTATQRALDELDSRLSESVTTHVADKSNPHLVTKEQVGLSNVTNDAQVKRSELGAVNGVATLNGLGLIPSNQLPSYVDDVIDCYATYDKSESGVLSNIKLYSDIEHQNSIVGESGKIYIDLELGYLFRWTGTIFATVGAPTVIGEITGTAFDGGRGKALENKTNLHIANINNPHNVTTEQIGAIPKGGLKTINGQLIEGSGDIEILTTANDVLFTSDLTITAPVGVHTIPSQGYKTLPTTGKSVKQVMDMLFASEKNPSITQPYVNITLTGAGAKEVGTMFTPSYSASLNPGSYQFGPATGVTATSWNITDTNGGTKDTATGSFNQFQVIDNTNYKVTAQAQHTEGAIPVTNLGNNYESGKIIAGSKSRVSSTVTGYRNSFYGTLTNKNELTSDAIRTLTKSNRALSNGATFNISIPVGALRVVIAYPATLRTLTSVLDVNGLNAQIVTSFTENRLNVEGLNGYQAIEYRVYILDYANPNDKGNTYKVTI